MDFLFKKSINQRMLVKLNMANNYYSIAFEQMKKQ